MSGREAAPFGGYLGNTDFDWYRFLRDRPELDEVNFWRPSGSRAFRVIEPSGSRNLGAGHAMRYKERPMT